MVLDAVDSYRFLIIISCYTLKCLEFVASNVLIYHQ